MSENTFFPSTRSEALAMLYLQSQDLSETTPERLGEWYVEVKQQIQAGISKASGGKSAIG